MKEIKFRAFEKDSEKMIYSDDCGDEWDIMLDNKKGLELVYIEDCQRYDAEFMQYTGLKDKNKKEIYEGDIVKVHYMENDEDYHENAQVVWCEESASFTPFNWAYDCEGCDCYVEITELEVIGNIYENPELLEK